MDQRNLIVAIVISVAIIFGWQFFFEMPRQQQIAEQQAAMQSAQQQGASSTAPQPPGGAPAPGAAGQAPVTRDRQEALAESPRLRIETPEIRGSIALKGARIDDVRLEQHRQTVDKNSPPVVLLSPDGGPNPYFVEYGWTSRDQNVKLPGPDTVWTADKELLGANQTATLSWDNGAGLIFKLLITVDDHFMFTVNQVVENKGGAPVELFPYALATRHGTPKTEGLFVLHEGPFGVFDETLKELSYSDVKDKRDIRYTTTGGWIGITDKYWMVTLIPDQKQPIDAHFGYSANGIEKHQVDYIGRGQVVAPGGSAQTENRVFAGAKIVKLVDAYREKYDITRFDLVIDWGWFFFLTKPLFWLLEKIYAAIGNFGLAIMALTVLVKLAFFPLANKSYQAMSKMKKLTPEMQRLRERYGDDRQKMNQELMALYKKEKVNPAAGCLPILVQIPVFFALYKVLYVTIEMRHAPFFGWINDLSVPDPLTILTGFGLFDWQVPQALSFLNIGLWPIIMGVTMYLQQKLNPQPADPIQAKVFTFMPIIFTFMLGHFAAGLVIYWAWNNTLSIIQQGIIMRRMGVKFGT